MNQRDEPRVVVRRHEDECERRARQRGVAPSSTTQQHEQREQEERDPLNRGECVVLHRDREVERREREGKPGDQRSELAPSHVAGEQVHRAAGEDKAQEDRRVVGAEAVTESAEHEREQPVHRLDCVRRGCRARKAPGAAGRTRRSPAPTTHGGASRCRACRPSCRCRSRRTRRGDVRERPCREDRNAGEGSDDEERLESGCLMTSSDANARKERPGSGAAGRLWPNGLPAEARSDAPPRDSPGGMGIVPAPMQAPEFPPAGQPLGFAAALELGFAARRAFAQAPCCGRDARPERRRLPLQRRVHPLPRLQVYGDVAAMLALFALISLPLSSIQTLLAREVAQLSSAGAIGALLRRSTRIAAVLGSGSSPRGGPRPADSRVLNIESTGIVSPASVRSSSPSSPSSCSAFCRACCASTRSASRTPPAGSRE